MRNKFFINIISIFFLFLSTEKVFSKINNSIIITVGNNPITRLDLFNEIKTIAILSNIQINESNQEKVRNLAIQSLIKKTIKANEIKKLGIENFNRKDLENLIISTTKRLGTDKNGLRLMLDKNGLKYEDLIKKFEIDLKWNTMIFKIYQNKISLNTVEIENKINLELKNLGEGPNTKEKIELLKKRIVRQEKNKKLKMFSNSHYSNLERVTQIKFL
tara:strand:+ start:672 stop:1322 length:651 start_codon:yes stop_codon:yes gene_type:complete